jgi:DNA-binding Xre family transcriptional regulator
MTMRSMPLAKLPIPKDVVEALHQVRLGRDLSYDALAEELEMSRPNVFRLMTQRGARVNDRTLNKIRRYLDTQNSQGASA